MLQIEEAPKLLPQYDFMPAIRSKRMLWHHYDPEKRVKIRQETVQALRSIYISHCLNKIIFFRGRLKTLGLLPGSPRDGIGDVFACLSESSIYYLGTVVSALQATQLHQAFLCQLANEEERQLRLRQMGAQAVIQAMDSIIIPVTYRQLSLAAFNQAIIKFLNCVCPEMIGHKIKWMDEKLAFSLEDFIVSQAKQTAPMYDRNYYREKRRFELNPLLLE